MPTTEWLSFPRTDGGTWRVNVTFLLSTYSCIYGAGCPGTRTGGSPEVACCAFGFTLEPEERKAITERMKMLTEDDWHLAGKVGAKSWYFKRHLEEGDDEPFLNSVTVLPDGTRVEPEEHPDARCIFFNTTPGKEGCAFHRAALRTGESHIEWKPTVCWTAPLATDYSNYPEVVLTAMTNLTWGQEEHEPLDWWCIEADEPYRRTNRSVYVTHEQELRALMGNHDYEHMASLLAGRLTNPERRRNRRYIPVRAADD